mmetsp:Transcript_10181/g.12904  ORF Transcript_10181/g.12904 Transcript_10181/m.12904 type:complete len:277 (+) Transcript_10181:144-974(+)
MMMSKEQTDDNNKGITITDDSNNADDSQSRKQSSPKQSKITTKSDKILDKRRKRKNENDAFYSDIKFTKRTSTGCRPGSPHRFFQSSYDVQIDASSCNTNSINNDETKAEESMKKQSAPKIVVNSMMIHRHVNGLCIVTVGECIKNIIKDLNDSIKEEECSYLNKCSSINIQNIQYLVDVTNLQSVGKKRKQAKKMQKGDSKFNNGNEGLVRPSDSLALVALTNGIVLDIKCCVCGTVMEINNSLKENVSLLVDDPLFDGYLCVVMPNGNFPPCKI